jgi:TolB-like protein
MKRIAFLALLIGLVVSVFAQNVSLDQAVQTSTQAIETRLPKGAKTAVLTFTSAKQAFSDYIIDELATALSASKNLQVIDRQHTEAIRKEFNIQFSGDVSDDEVRRVGHQLGAQYVVTGSLVDIGNAYRFRVAAINIETAVREGSSSLNINSNDPQVTFLLTGRRTSQTSGTSGNSGKIFKVGDYGPARGIVFYDKGVFSNGWRYLEAAPSETEFTAQWSTNGLNVPGTATSTGAGKRNTQLIADYIGSNADAIFAAQLCIALNYDGFYDWYLPSRDELDLMYKNLKQKGLGNFSGEWYWASSQDHNRDAWSYNFNNGTQNATAHKLNTYSVRAVRAF